MTRWPLFAALSLGLAVFAAAAAAPTSDPLDAALEQRIRGKAALDDVEIAAFWQHEQGGKSARVWGRGLGVWSRKTQFRLSREEVVELLKMLVAARVGTMPEPGAKRPAGEHAKAPLRLVGELTVVAGPAQRTLRQLGKGEQSENLQKLVERILAVCEKAAKTGVAASSLEDGLAKLAEEKLEPEVFEAVVVRRRSEAGAAGWAESWLLRVDGRRVTDRLMPKGRTPPPPRQLTISESDFRKLARLLQENSPATLPNKLYSAGYTDVTLEVLAHDRTIPARSYLGVTPETHGAAQRRFERIYEAFRALHERAREEGIPVSEPPPRAAATPAPEEAKPSPTPSSPAGS